MPWCYLPVSVFPPSDTGFFYLFYIAFWVIVNIQKIMFLSCKKNICILFFILLPLCVSARVLNAGIYSKTENSPEYESGLNKNYFESYLRLIAAEMGDQCLIQDIPHDQAFKELENGHLDLLLNTVYVESRPEKFLYSTSPCASEYIFLVAARKDKRYANGDIGSLKNARIGLVFGDSVQEELLNAFNTENDLHIEKVYYTGDALMSEGLKRGVVDLHISTALTVNQNEKIIRNFGMRPLYFIFRDPEIKKSVDAAMASLYKKNPLYQVDLVLQNHDIRSLDFSNITKTEKDYIKLHPRITVLTSDGNAPFSYFDTSGIFTGIYRKLWDEVSLISGLSFAFYKFGTLPQTSPIVYLSTDNPTAERTEVRFTNPFDVVKVRLVCAPGLSSHSFISPGSNFSSMRKVRIAVTGDIRSVIPYFEERFMSVEAVILSSPEKCLEQTASGRCDAAVIQDYYLQTTYDLNDYPSLRGRMPELYSVPLSIAVAGQDAEILIHILNKAISQIPLQFLDNEELQEGAVAAYSPAKTVIMRQRLVTFLLILIMVLLYSVISIVFNTFKYKKLSEIDLLTGLWNLTCFEQHAEKLMASLPKNNFILSEVNIRSFAQINRVYGSEMADRILQFLANELRRIKSDKNVLFIARGYADSFYVLRSADSRDTALGQIHTVMHEIFRREETFGIRIVIKTGSVFTGPDYGGFDSIKNLVGKAGYARKSIRDSVVDNFALFDEILQQKRLLEGNIESCMSKALTNHEFFVVFQPKVDIRTGKIKSAEALVRWNSPENGLVSPEVFIPVLEKNGYAVKMDFYVYQSVFEYLQHSLDDGRPVVPVSLNISRLHTSAEKFVTDFMMLYSKYNIPPQYIELEIVERSAGSNDNILKEITDMLHRHGFLVAMDDFGAGESSLNMLSEIPVDEIKFDQRFLKKAESSPDSATILREMMKMAQMLGKVTVCEGVETEAQLVLLKDIGCDLAQGFYYSKALMLDDFKEYLMEHM